MNINEQQDQDKLTVKINSCPRCGGYHPSVELKKFQRDTDGKTHWGMCPTLEEPILLKISTRIDLK